MHTARSFTLMSRQRLGGGAAAGGTARARAAERVAERRGGEAEVRGGPQLRGLHIQGLPAQPGPGIR